MITKQRWVLFFTWFMMIFCFVTWSKVLLLNEHSDAIKLKFEIPHYEIGSKIIDGKRYNSIIDRSEPSTNDKGFPEVPYYTQSIIIGDNSVSDIEVINIEFTEIKISRLVPSRGQIKRNQDPNTIPFTLGKIYTQNIWYPEKNVTITEPFIFRDVRGVTVTFNPFQYNAVLGILRIAEEIEISVNTTGMRSKRDLQSIPEITSDAFANIYREMFVNYSSHRSALSIPDGDRMLIIAADKYRDKLSEFVEWKIRKGIRTTVHSYPSETGKGVYNLHKFIDKKYVEEKVTYVLLVGNGKDIPGNDRIRHSNSRIVESDPPYSLVTDDIYPEVFIGRFCVDNDKQLQTIIAKSINYEKEPDIDGTWYENALLNASKEKKESPKADWEWILEFADSLKKGGYKNTYIYSQEGAGNLTPGTATTTSAEINKGVGWFSYMGHGTPEIHKAPKFTTIDILKLSNYGKYPVCISVACSNGAYNKAKNGCMGQIWTVAGSPTKGIGGVVFLGSSIETEWVPPQYGMQGMMKIIAQKGDFLSVGNIVNNGLVLFLGKYRRDAGYTFATWNFFGDPSIYLRSAKPIPLTVIHPKVLDKGKHEFEVKAPDNTIVCVYGKSQDIWQTKKIIGGIAKFAIEVKKSNDSIYVTGNGKNTIPYLGAINGGSTGNVNNYFLNVKTNASIHYNNAINRVIFTFPEKYSNVSIAIYGVNGRLVYSKNINHSNTNEFSWNFTNTKGLKLAKGMYHVSMIVKTGNKTVSKLHRAFICKIR